MDDPPFMAYSIGRPLLESLAKKPFFGYVSGIYKHSCNIMGADGRIITLALPSIGKGPFSIVVEGKNLLTSITTKMCVRSDHHGLAVNNMQFIHLNSVDCWEPRLFQFPRSFHIKTSIAELLKDYTQWLEEPNGVYSDEIVKNQLVMGAKALQHALSNGHSTKKIVTYLAGLGFGLTPSGDDYLLGVMASLWLTRNTSFLDEIAQTANRKTTSLSANLLKAASKGEFSESWHQLAKGIFSQDTKTAQHAVFNFSQIGAFSGRDALAGFTTHLLGSRFSSKNRAGSKQLP